MEVDFITSKLLETENYSFISDEFPVGSIVAYAGDLTNLFNRKKLYMAGWLLCDGKLYDKNEKPALYNAIGETYGGSCGIFSVPDLRNHFLKGRTKGNGNSNRKNSLNTQNGFPLIGFSTEHSLYNRKSIDRLTSVIDFNCSGRASKNQASLESDIINNIFSGSELSKNPVNIALYYIIKANNNKTSGKTPTGAIIAYGGDTKSAMPGWLKCDGSFHYNMAYSELHKTISSNYGNAGRNFFNVPDLRGTYIKGKSHYTPFDTLVKQELMGEMQVNTVSSNFDNSVLLPPGPLAPAPGGFSNQTDEQKKFIFENEKKRNPSTYADFLIANTNFEQSGPPVGSVMCFGGDYSNPMIRKALSEEGWLPCDGSYLVIEKYHELYNVIGSTYGGGNLTFNLPDLRGLYIVGAGHLPVGEKLYVSDASCNEIPEYKTNRNTEESDNIYVPSSTGVDYIIRVR